MQVAQKICPSKTTIVGCDLLPMENIAGTHFVQGDFTDATIQKTMIEKAGGKIDLLLSDMSPNMIGHKRTDYERINFLVELSFQFALANLCHGGHFITKTRQSGTEAELLKKIKNYFTKTYHFKPKASRLETSEVYLIASGFQR